jgi:flagellin
MGLRINQNIAAMNSYRNLSVTDGQMAKSLEKLSSGFRINRAADDAAGLSISEGLRAQVGGLKVAVRNAQDGVSVVQTAEGALTEVHSILQRMRDLAVQASNSGSQDLDARTAAQTELTNLNAELDRIGSTTKFGAQKLLDGTFGVQAAKVSTAAAAQFTLSSVDGTTNAQGVKITLAGVDATAATDVTIASTGYTDDAAGAAALQKDLQASIDAGALKGLVTATVTYDSLTGKASATFARTTGGAAGDTITTAAPTTGGGAPALAFVAAAAGVTPTGTAASFQVGANNTTNDKISVSIGKVDASALGTTNVDLVASASAAIDTIDNAIKSVSTTRANLGAFQNRFEHAINNLNVAVENLSASESRIRDTDMASEMMNFTRAQILSQAGTAMLAQANQAPQGVLRLLQ